MSPDDRIDYFVHGRGRGHASRVPAVLRGLTDTGHSVRLHAGGDALDLLRGVVPQPQVSWLDRAPLWRGPSTPLRLAQRALKDARSFSASRPKLVVSDGDQAAALAARALGIPVLMVGHDLIFSGRVVLPTLPRWAHWRQRLNALPTELGDRFVAVHFLPATSRDPRLCVARPEVPATPAFERSDGPLVCYFRDPNAAPVVRQLAESGQRVLWFGAHADESPGVTALPFSAESFRRALEVAVGVVGSAGSNLLAECVLLSKPLLALYRPGDAEQHLNAVLADRAGVAVGSSLPDASSSGIPRFLERLQQGAFERIPLANALPPLSQAVRASVAELL